jgi:Transcriptional regulatory protein, C terminal
VLRYLVEHPGRLVTHDQRLQAVWPDTYVQPELIRRYIVEIRRALGDRPEAPGSFKSSPSGDISSLLRSTITLGLIRAKVTPARGRSWSVEQPPLPTCTAT